MADNNAPENIPDNPGKSIKEMSTDLFNSLKTPVFWVALGFLTCKFMDRKNK